MNFAWGFGKQNEIDVFAPPVQPAQGSGKGLAPWKVLAVYDGTESSERVLRVCKDLAVDDTEVIVVTLCPLVMTFVGLEGGIYDPELDRAEQQRCNLLVERAVRRCAALGKQFEIGRVADDTVAWAFDRDLDHRHRELL